MKLLKILSLAIPLFLITHKQAFPSTGSSSSYVEKAFSQMLRGAYSSYENLPVEIKKVVFGLALPIAIGSTIGSITIGAFASVMTWPWNMLPPIGIPAIGGGISIGALSGGFLGGMSMFAGTSIPTLILFLMFDSLVPNELRPPALKFPTD